MEEWSDHGIVISAKKHADHGAVVTLLTENHGKHMGYVQGGMSSKKKALLELGNHVHVTWKARLSENMGAFSLDLEQNFSSQLLHDYLRLLAMQSACALLDRTLAEREEHQNLYHGTLALFEMLQGDVWAESYIIWEISLLKELGFGLDLSRCAAGGSADNLVYVSPKSAIAVSKEEGAAYKDKLLPLPQFLLGKDDDDHQQAIQDGLHLTAYFLEHRVFADTSFSNLPLAREELSSTLKI